MEGTRPKGVIWYIAARPCLKESLQLLYENFNREYRYPVLVFTFGKQYSSRFIKDIHQHIGPAITFIQLPSKQVPSHIKEEELFYSRKEIPYVRKSFPKSRIGYMHTNHFVAGEVMYHPAMQGYDIALKMDDDTFITGKINYDILQFVQDNGYKFASFATTKFETENALQCQIGFRELVKKYITEHDIVPVSTRLDKNGNWDSCGPWDPTVWDLRIFQRREWKDWWDAVHASGGIYKYRWGDLEIHAVYLAMYYPDSAWHNFDFYRQGKCRHGGHGRVLERSAFGRTVSVAKRIARKLGIKR